MSESASPVAERWRRVSSTFTQRVAAVPPDDWNNETPCEGWVARDVVRHLVEWVPGFLSAGADVTLPDLPCVDEDPAGAWRALSDEIQAILDADDIGERTFDHPMAGSHPLDQAIERFVLNDVLIHTWDLARATGQDEQLDPEMVAGMAIGMAAMGDALEQSGQFGRRVPVAADADEQTKLLALTGRRV